MPSSSRTALCAVGIALAACSSPSSAPRACGSDADCPAAARCLAGACVANAAPLPAIALPQAALETNVLLGFDGSASTDPDEGDAVVGWAWTFRALDAPCAPPVVASAEPLARVRFACPGRYAADLTVTDELARSATRTEEFEVTALDGPGLLTVGADVSLDHACTTAPPRCAPAGEVTLSASAPAVDSPDLTFLWTVEPPADRPLDPTRRVELVPDAFAAAPSVSIETDGQAISGDWIFRVEARDGAGVVGTAATRVSIGNRAPVVQTTIPVPPHTFEGDRFTARGEIPFTVTDPDGDPLGLPVVGWRHAGDGGGTFTGTLLADPARVTFWIEVPYAAPDDALHLIGGESLERSVTFEVTDVNGATTSEVWPILVGNQPPLFVSPPAASSFPHLYDAAAAAYRAAPSLSAWSDPDGDPLWQVATAATGDPSCPAFTVAGGTGARQAVADCSLAFEVDPAVGNFARAHVVTQTVQDPWAQADRTSTVTFTIENRPPAITSLSRHVVTDGCTKAGGCCEAVAGECVIGYYTAAAVPSAVPSRWTDPDGDPLEVKALPAGFVSPVQPLVCTPADCVLQLEIAAMVNVCGSVTQRLTTTVSDGQLSASGPLDVERSCQNRF